MNYFYYCKSCKTSFDANFIEKSFYYLCPTCGSAQKNKPLTGVLQIEYDYRDLKKKFSKNSLLNCSVGDFSEYKYLWPFAIEKSRLKNIPDELINKVKLTSNPIINFNYNNRLISFFDDTRNPTLSYKDRASIIVVMKALQLGIKEISVASTGNAGSSLAGICSRLGVKAKVFVPEKIPDAKRIQIQAFGADIFIMQGDYDYAFDCSMLISKKENWYNRNTAYNPLTIEGKKSSIFDMFISLKGNLPDYILIPVGDGVIISGIFKGLYDLYQLGWIKKYPKLIAIQAKGSDGIYRYWKTGIFKYKSANTIADSLCAGAPRNLFLATDAIKTTNGESLVINDNEIIIAQKYLAREYGVLCEPAASATFAGFLKYIKKIPKNKTVMLMITGNGLKDVTTLGKWNKKPLSKNIKL